MIDGLNFGIELTVCEILFGLSTYNNPDLKLTFDFIFIDKWFLNNVKTQNKPMYFLVFITLVKNKIEVSKNISAINNGDVESWVDDLWAIIDY